MWKVCLNHDLKAKKVGKKMVLVRPSLSNVFRQPENLYNPLN